MPGCDEVYEFLGIGGETEEEKPNQPEAPEQPEVPKQPVTPLAEGGEVDLVPKDGEIWEVHTFTESETLTFFDGRESVTADYLIVAGGGGAGGSAVANTDHSGGGGAGGLLYLTDQNLSLDEGSVNIVVGVGGPGGGTTNQVAGTNGGDSAIGSLVVPGGGGGGGGKPGGTKESSMDGKAGGSGGGGGTSAERGAAGTTTGGVDVWGNVGGLGSVINITSDPGGGGGGAGSPGGDAVGGTSSVAGAGGLGWRPSANDAAWIEDVTGVEEFSHGGIGGKVNVANNPPAANYGDGGAASSADTAGRGGIVVIRFKQ